MAPVPLLSIVVECGTRTLSNAIPFQKMATAYLAEARATLSDSKFELLFVGRGLPEIRLPEKCRMIDLDTGYYGFKNGGAQLARGRYIVFWDSDCRAKKGYLKTVLEAFRENPRAIGVSGVTQYDGSRYLTRLNSVLSFGAYYDRGTRFLTSVHPLTHNITIRRSAFPRKPFGPFNGRINGDSFISRYAQKKGRPILLMQDLRIFHEDPSVHIVTLLERHLRDVFQPMNETRLKSMWKVGFHSLLFIPRLSVRRFRRIERYGSQAGIHTLGLLASIPVLMFYGLTDFLAVSGMLLYRPWLSRWMEFQFGTQWMKSRGWV